MSTQGGLCSRIRANGQTELLVLAQLPIPAVGRIEQRREAFEPQPVERAGEGGLAETLRLQGIGEDFAQGSAGHDRACRAAGRRSARLSDA